MEVTDIGKLLADNAEGTFLEFSSFNGRSFGTCDITGVSPGWEMHPDTDEFCYIIEGTFEIGGQEHFYLEGQAALAIPGEDGEMLGETGLERLLKKLKGQRTDAMLEALLWMLGDYAEGKQFPDDISGILFEFKGAQPRARAAK